MKNVLVTGVAGFLGSHLCDELLSRHYNVVGIDNFFRGKKENLPKHENFKFYEQDLVIGLPLSILRDNKIDTIFHYAAINGTEHFYDKPYQVFNDNIDITKNVMESAKLNGKIEKVIYTSTSEIYGDNPPLPTKESEPILLNVFSDRDSYASSKAIGEFYVKYWCKKSNSKYIILRPFNTYGKRMDNTKYGQVVPEFFRKTNEKEFTLIGDGSQTRSFCHVDDHKRLAVNMAESDKVDDEILNIGNDEQITILQLAEKVHETVGKEFNPKFLPPREYDTQRRQPDISKIKLLFSNYEFISIDEGLRKML
jgi:nucleoside-diphosphate-sugar epimerase|tara:strand:+ start:2295 stop:3221 length:927 start_codon:yes stop_codon:yes gene_type:complete